MQVAGAGIVTETGPQMQDVIDGRGRQRMDVGELTHEALEVGNDGADLGLLQHDFRHPDPVGVGVLLPGQMVTAVLREPAQDGVGKGGGQWHGGSMADQRKRLSSRLRAASWNSSGTASSSRSCTRRCTESRAISTNRSRTLPKSGPQYWLGSASNDALQVTGQPIPWYWDEIGMVCGAGSPKTVSTTS